MLYNIWLGLNILYEIVLPVLWLVALLALVWGATLVFALLRAPAATWRKTLPLSALVGVLGAALVFALGPALSSSSFADLDYWVDWAFLVGGALTAGLVLWVATWPGLTCLRKA
jgi:hypothetical protein